ncbi:MAG: type I 3-dehydroquinate dehydratase [Spirochaetaceae bacterium]|jgi:3-dehydroquinate dehydratase/shikimate dehydrogenase|nr:type I 3-dehydroquinate dehydratase [Spirochaetaceae bacterium]
MTKICLCLTAKTIERDLEILKKYRKYIDIAELRADCLTHEECFSIRRFPELAGLPVILTIRRKSDGGCFEMSESSRVVLLSKAMAFAEVDVRHNFAYIDLEEDIELPGLEEAARAFGTKIIRSFHSFNGPYDNLIKRINALYHVGDEIAKAAIKIDDLDDVTRLFQISKEITGKEKILIGMGDSSICTRILAKKLGSIICYTSPKDEKDLPVAAPGQLDPIELGEFYRFRSITREAKIYGILGYPLKATSSPSFFNRIFDRENKNAVYIPFPSQSVPSFFRLADEIGLLGASVTVPHKEAVLPHLTSMSEQVVSVGACNTIVRSETGWDGYNTDTEGFSGSLLNFIERKNFKGKRITIVGAGGASRAVASEIHRLKGKAVILNRNEIRAQQLAEAYHFQYGGLDPNGIKLIKKFPDIIIQTTSMGMEPDINDDPLRDYQFTGKEVVMDIIYKPEMTALLKRAANAGCRTLNGTDMLLRQAKLQYQYFFGKTYPED